MVSVIHHFVPSADLSTEGLREFVKNLPPPIEGSTSSAALAPTEKSVPWLPHSSGVDASPMALPTPESSPRCVVDDVEDTLLVDAMNIPREYTHQLLSPRVPFLVPARRRVYEKRDKANNY